MATFSSFAPSPTGTGQPSGAGAGAGGYGAAAGAVLDFAGGFFDRAAQRRANEANRAYQTKTNVANREFQREMFNRELQASRDFWNMQNAYNSPTAQMARLKAAGLNPNLVYGNGATTLASSPSVPSGSASNQQAPRVAPASLGSAFRGLSRGIGNYFAYRNMKLQGDLTDSQVVNNVLSAFGKGIDNDIKAATKSDVISTVRERLSNLRADTTSKSLSNRIATVNANLAEKYGEKRVQQELALMAKKLSNLSADINIKKFNYGNMVKYGIMPSDHVLRRLLIKNLVNQGINPQDFVRSLLGFFGYGGESSTVGSMLKSGIKFFLK